MTLESIDAMGEQLRDLINSVLPMTRYEPAREALKLALAYVSTRGIEIDLKLARKRALKAAQQARYRAKKKARLG